MLLNNIKRNKDNTIMLKYALSEKLIYNNFNLVFVAY